MNNPVNLYALSPLDGRYAKQTNKLSESFSEAALIKNRLKVEALYLIKLLEFIKPETAIPQAKKQTILNLWQNLEEQDLLKVKAIEERINHDVKAIEYYFKGQLINLGLDDLTEWIHFGLTSEDINNIAYSLMLRESLDNVLLPAIKNLIIQLSDLSRKYAAIPMLARTHGQPASPTTLGKEIAVFLSRIIDETQYLTSIKLKAKLNGATGNFNAFYAAFPDKNWLEFSCNLLSGLGFEANILTTQIEPHDTYATVFDSISRLNNIVLDLDTDIWHYISLNYFSLFKSQNEVGSSTMPHKINPIDFENSEGNLGMANSILGFMKNKLTKSRLQRDLSDSTVLRNIGVALGYSLLGVQSTLKGMSKLNPLPEKLSEDLQNNVEVLAEAIQTILRAEGIEKPYELLKELTRGNKITIDDLHIWINNLEISQEIKDKILRLRPETYIGIAAELAKITVEKAKNFLLTGAK